MPAKSNVVVGRSDALKPKRKRRLWPWLLIVGFWLVVGAAIAAYLLLPGYLMRLIEKEARAQGVVLEGCSLDFSLEQVTLTDCKFELVDLPSVKGTLGTVEVSIEDYEPKSILVSGPVIEVRELPDVPLAERLPHWLEERQRAGKDAAIPITVERGRLEFFGLSATGRSDGAPLVSLSDVGYKSTDESAQGAISIGGMITGAFRHRDARSELDVKLAMSPTTKLRLSVETQADAAEFRADFDGLPLAALAIPPLVKLPDALRAVQADGQVYAKVPFGLDAKGIRGDFRVTLLDLPMPVPREIQGLVYGPEVFTEGKFKLHQNNKQLDVKPLKVKAGVLELKGNAKLEVRGVRVPFAAQLTGALSCGAILEAATKAHTKSPLALEAARLGRKALTGSVGIVVALDGDLLRLPKTKLLRTIGIGCGLQPLPLPGELEDLADRIRDGLPTPPRLPDAPELEIELPKPPSFELPKLPGFGGKKELDDQTPEAEE